MTKEGEKMKLLEAVKTLREELAGFTVRQREDEFGRKYADIQPAEGCFVFRVYFEYDGMILDCCGSRTEYLGAHDLRCIANNIRQLARSGMLLTLSTRDGRCIGRMTDMSAELTSRRITQIAEAFAYQFDFPHLQELELSVAFADGSPEQVFSLDCTDADNEICAVLEEMRSGFS